MKVPIFQQSFSKEKQFFVALTHLLQILYYRNWFSYHYIYTILVLSGLCVSQPLTFEI